jgi:hypothetical protein
MRQVHFKQSIETLIPGEELKARILALPMRPSPVRPERPRLRLQIAAFGGACLLCAAVAVAFTTYNNAEKPGSNALGPAPSLASGLPAGQGTDTATNSATEAVTASASSPTPSAASPTPSKEAMLTPTAPVLTSDQNIGADMASLDYASDDTVIFHGYFGLFVYDLKSKKIMRSVALAPIGCDNTQGDNCCIVSVSKDGNTVQLHPVSSKSMYVYTVSDNTLQKTAYVKIQNPFADFVETANAVGHEKANCSSDRAVKFSNGEYGYLNAKDWLIRNLVYVRGELVYKVFDKELK